MITSTNPKATTPPPPRSHKATVSVFYSQDLAQMLHEYSEASWYLLLLPFVFSLPRFYKAFPSLTLNAKEALGFQVKSGSF